MVTSISTIPSNERGSSRIGSHGRKSAEAQPVGSSATCCCVPARLRAALIAGSVDELAGVLGHEIGHVKGRHIARLQEETAIPNLLANLAGILATAATGEPGFVMAAQGVNVALQLQYTRELEDEADHIGSIFMARAGYEPIGMVRFFERIEVCPACTCCIPRSEIGS